MNDDAANAENTAVDNDLLPPGMEEVEKEVEKVKKAKTSKTAKTKGDRAPKGKGEKAPGAPGRKMLPPIDPSDMFPVGTKVKSIQGVSGVITDLFYRVKKADGRFCNMSAKTARKG